MLLNALESYKIITKHTAKFQNITIILEWHMLTATTMLLQNRFLRFTKICTTKHLSFVLTKEVAA